MLVHRSGHTILAAGLYLDMRLVVVAHGHLRQLVAYLDHGIVEYICEAVVILESFYRFLNKVKTQPVLVHGAAQEVWCKSIVVRVGRATAAIGQQFAQYDNEM